MVTAFLREKKQSKSKSSTPKSTPLKGFNTTSITKKVICTKKNVPEHFCIDKSQQDSLCRMYRKVD